MPANLEDHNHPGNSASKVSTRGSRSQEIMEPSSSGAGGSSNWLRSFTCFTTSADDEQIALDLSGRLSPLLMFASVNLSFFC